MKYMTGLCSKTSFHCASLSRKASVARCSALVRLSSSASICLRVLPTRRTMIIAARNKAISSATAIKWSAMSGAGPSTSQMQAAASHASAMPPRSDCSAERENFSFWLRMAATKHSAIRARAASSRDHDHPRQQRGPSNGLHLSSFSRSEDYSAPRYAQPLSVCRRGRSSRPQAPAPTIAECAWSTTASPDIARSPRRRWGAPRPSPGSGSRSQT